MLFRSASLFFYAWGEPTYVVLFMISILMNYILGRIIDANYGSTGARIGFITALAIDLGMLAVFKYAGFLVSNVNALLHINIPDPGIRLPLGISFYTFFSNIHLHANFRLPQNVIKRQNPF